MKKIILFVFALFLLYNASALTNPITTAQPVYPNGQTVNLSVPCTFGGAFCPTLTECNITILDPDSVVLANNEVMTKNSSVFNYTLSGNSTTKNGQYEVAVSCCNGIICKPKLLSFLITPSGADPLTSGQGTVLMIVMGVMFFVAVIFFVIGFRSESVAGKATGYSLGGVMILVLILYSLLVANEAIASSPKLIAGFETFYFVMKMIGTIAIVGMIVLLLLVAVRAWKIKRGLIDR
jgi:uncharacterized membrane protein YwzB